MILFLAMTPAQLMNAVVLAKSSFFNQKCDIYITPNLSIYLDKLSRCKVFNEIYGYDLVKDITNRGNVVSRAIVRIKNALDMNSIKKTLRSDPNKYERIFVSGISLRNYEVYYAIKSVNKDIRLSLYEEGICEYYQLMEKNPFKIIFSYIFFHRYYMRDCEDLYVYEPSVVRSKWDNIIIKQIPRFINNKEILTILNELFSYSTNEMLFDKKVIFLESAFYSNDLEELQLCLIEKTIERFGKDNVIIKMHPRSQLDKYNSDYLTMHSSTPLEIMAANLDVEDNIFVSLSSSGVINFKLMLNKEPTIICLNGIYKKRIDESDKVFDRVAQLCEKNNFYLINQVEDYDLFIMSSL